MRYATEHDREKAELDRMVGRMRAAGAPFGPEVIDTADRFVRGKTIIHTGTAYARALLRYFRWCGESGLHPWQARHSHAELFHASLRELAPGTRRNYVIATRSFYRFAVIDEVIAKSPFQYVSAPSPDPIDPTPALTMDQLKAVLRPMHRKIADGTATLCDRRDYAMIRLDARIGARLVSVTEMTWGGWAYRGSDGVLTYVQKGGGGHSVVLPPEDASVLEGWRAALAAALGREPRDDEPVFPKFGPRAMKLPKRDLRPMMRSGLRDAVKARYLAVGLRGRRLAFHALRATSATIGSENGATIEQIKKTGGWKSHKMAELYIKRQSSENALQHWSINLDDEPAA